MSQRRELVLGAGTAPAEDELRLPRPPGVIRRFWARHTLLADIVLAVLALLLSMPTLVVRAPNDEPLTGVMLVVGIVLALGGCVALLWRRRWPVTVFAVSLLPALALEPALAGTLSGPVSVIALYSVAVYRSVRACWISFGVACGLVIAHTVAGIVSGSVNAGEQINIDLSMMVMLLIGALVGVNVGNRRRYLDALIDRSRQLVIERDQQALLAAAAERARIAREMHDIVSHSLTVVVALAEGASVTADAQRAREATRAVAATARQALSEMRSMLGVLRADDDPQTSFAPIWDASVHDVVANAQRAGLPVTLTVTGTADTSPAQQLAVRRIVQEALTNATRYANDPSLIHARIDYSGDSVRIVVENDGARAHAPSVGAGWGLVGLRERVASLNGTFDAGMVAPHVWRVTAQLPKEQARE